jgi:hypothetical protein
MRKMTVDITIRATINADDDMTGNDIMGEVDLILNTDKVNVEDAIIKNWEVLDSR